MPEYRAYTVGLDGHFIGFEPLVCHDDSEAVSKAKQLLDGLDIEVWCAERLVIHLKRKSNETKICNVGRFLKTRAGQLSSAH
jgi:hypothetical protein